MKPDISVNVESPNSADACVLLEELSKELETITGNSGKHSFEVGHLEQPKAVFVIARNMSGKAVGNFQLWNVCEQT